MSSGFVSGGTIDAPVERDDEWRRAEAELEANRLRKEQEGRQEGGKSLYEVLQANKGEYTQYSPSPFPPQNPHPISLLNVEV